MLRSWLISVVLAGLLVGATNAQVPTIAVYGDSDFSNYQFRCGPAYTTSELVVVLNNARSIVSAVDFTIGYPPALFWLYDQISDASYTGSDRTIVTLGSSPSGIAMAWATCCMPDGREGPIVLIRPVVIWSPQCDCDGSWGPYVVTVSGYSALGKTEPSYISYPDFAEHTAIGLDMVFCGGSMPVESTTWGKIKALYR